MKVGDLVKHKYGTLTGSGVITKTYRLGPKGSPRKLVILWNHDGNISVQKLEEQYCEVISESR